MKGSTHFDLTSAESHIFRTNLHTLVQISTHLVLVPSGGGIIVTKCVKYPAQPEVVRICMCRAPRIQHDAKFCRKLPRAGRQYVMYSGQGSTVSGIDRVGVGYDITFAFFQNIFVTRIL